MSRRVKRWLRLRVRTPGSIAQQVDEEIAFHIEQRARELIAGGVPRAAAQLEAERRFGTLKGARVTLLRAAERRERRLTMREWLGSWSQDFRYSARALWRERTMSGVVVLTLALGLGATTVMFGIVDHLLLRGPAHVVDADEVKRVYVTQNWFSGYGTSQVTGYVTYAQLRDRATTLSGAAAYRIVSARLGRGESARQVPIGWATADLFSLLGVRPHIGRFFTAEEDRPDGAAQVAVLDHGLWLTEYGGAIDVIGRTLSITDVAYEIIGVMPAAFTGPELQPVMAWLPMSAGFTPNPEWTTTWDATWLSVVARLRPGVAVEDAEREATAIYRAAADGHDESAAQGLLTLRPLHHNRAGTELAEAAVARWLLAVSLIVLLIAMANVVNLLIARVLRRRRELAIRLALGVSRARLARLLFSESLLLAVAGFAAALALARWSGDAVRLLLLPDVQWGPPLGGRTVLFGVAAAVLTGLFIGVVPALQSTRQHPTAGLRAASGGSALRRAHGRSVLTVLQAALSVMLLMGAGLFVRSLWNVSRVDLGIDTDRLLAVSVNFDPIGAAAEEEQTAIRERRRAFWEDVVDRLRAEPGIAAAARAIGTPLQGSFGVTLRVPGRDSIPELPGGGPFITAATPGYFETVGTRIVRGRGFEKGEGRGTEPVVIVSETMARTLWPNEQALGQCLIVGDMDAACARVVGVAEDAHRAGIRQEPMMQYYVPIGQETGIAGSQIIVRPRGNAAAYIPQLRHVLHAMEPGIVHLRIARLQDVIDPEVRPWRLGATMFLLFGLLAMLIAAVGLYSVIAYGVTQRRTEIAVRLAVGAGQASITALVLWQGIALVVVGTAFGGALAFTFAPRLEPLLFDTTARDPAVLFMVAAILVAVAILASLLPALRARRTDPALALRE